MYSIVDIETTGGVRSAQKITEIAIVHFDGSRVKDRYSSLVNPERPIPPFISRYTGITNEMVADSPPFFKIAKEVVERLEGKVFVAHNVYFDYNVLRGEFRELGYTLSCEKLCTVRLSRKTFPGLPSYSLGKLCESLEIPLQNRHRAMGDADATVLLFEKILKEQSPEQLEEEKNHRKLLLPPQIDEQVFENLPNECGVYFFWDDQGELLYVGKSKDIQKRVAGHFRFKSERKKAREMKERISNITYLLTGNELCARLIECDKIKKHRPAYNRAMNRIRFRYVLSLEETLEGLLEIKLRSASLLSNKKRNDQIRFHSSKTAKKKRAWLYREAFGLDVESIGFERQLELFSQTLGVPSFNEKLRKAFSRSFYMEENFALTLKGRTKTEQAVVKVKENQLTEIRFINDDGTGECFELTEDEDMKNILLSYLAKHATEMKEVA